MIDRKTAVLFDWDSCMSYTEQRWHLSPMVNPDSNWAIYSAACLADPPLPGTLAAMRLHYPYHQVHICSGSDESARPYRLEWLIRWDVAWDVLRVRRPEDAELTNEDIKVGYVLELRARGIEVVLAYEDWEPAATAIYARTGVPVVGVNPFYPEDLLRLQQSRAVDGKGGGL